MTVLLFLAVLFVLILVHEWGHFIVAKKNGIRVDEFGIGFPPKLFGIKKGETEYTFNALPIGGFVKIFGEDGSNAPSSPVADEGSDRRSELVSGEAGEGGANVNSEDWSRAFAAKSKWVQAAVLIAGVTMNVLFAWLLFTVVLVAGVPTQIEESAATDASELIVSDILPDGPAAEAGLPAGAVVTGLSAGGDSVETLYPSTFSAFTEQNAGVEMMVTYRFGDETNTVSLVPETGVIESSPDQAAVGVALALVETVSTPLHLAVYEGFLMTLHGLKNITFGLSGLLVDSVRGEADMSQVAGPIGIVGLVGDAAEFGWTSLAMFTAFISLNLAIINMLPIPALDGGRLLFVGIEAIRRKPINPAWQARVNFAGFALLMLLMLAVTYNDILRIL